MFDCLIVGAGPAGLTAGVYLRRFLRSICIVDNNQSRAERIPLSRNYPGFPKGINGKELLALLRAQLGEFDGAITEGTVTNLRRTADGHFSAEFAGRKVAARTVLLATGVVDVEPDIPGYEDVKDSGLIRFCPVCDGFEFADQRVGVIGTGAHGMREFEFIRDFSERVTYVGLDCGLKPVRITGDHGGIGIELEDGSMQRFDVVYCALGCKVRSMLARAVGAGCDQQGCCVVSAHQETSVAGLFAAGDVVSGLDQLAVAAGQAAIAATAIHNRLRSN